MCHPGFSDEQNSDRPARMSEAKTGLPGPSEGVLV